MSEIFYLCVDDPKTVIRLLSEPVMNNGRWNCYIIDRSDGKIKILGFGTRVDDHAAGDPWNGWHSPKESFDKWAEAFCAKAWDPVKGPDFVITYRGVRKNKPVFDTIGVDRAPLTPAEIAMFEEAKILNKPCEHEWVNVSFMGVKLACKKCNLERDAE